ncbi:ASCH domain-containing protein [uncultured Winogradskyella sp.]|uniref:ASCH domain-containing protein n=1 Tax=uncultured Winogradskyella sp. TaxID=395353 RepID=UPI00260A61DF|nr:ASCH domain-containing protein [uncultured Winogradskyella sp.]
MKKRITIILFLVLIGCKNETKTEKGIDKTVYEIWNSFTKANPDFSKDQLPESWYFHNNEEDANRLAELVVSGKKRAGSGLYSWYKDANADLPKIGTKHIITDFEGKAKAIIEIKKVDTIPFHKISEDYAQMDMGTTIEPLKKWRKAHWDFFASTMEENGKKPTEEMLIVCERFETIWPINP